MDAECRPTWVEVDLDAIRTNVAALKGLSRAPHFMAVVKADGYGHGALQVAQAALEAGADWLGVAMVEEGVELRRHGITAPILVLGYVGPGQAPLAVQHDIRAALWDLDLALALDEAARAQGRTAKVHLKVDTGMGRVGRRPGELAALARSLASLRHVEVEGVFTHFAVADVPGSPETARQQERFEAALAELQQAGLRPAIRHAANTAALMLNPETHYDLVRAGIGIYGLEPSPGIAWPVTFKPALTWKSRVSMVKWVEAGMTLSYGCTYTARAREQIATLPVGYADGLFRLLSNRGAVLIQGQRCPIVGRICMDQTLVRLPDGLEAAPGDEAVLIGRQGGLELSATEMAGLIGTINYEVVCAISHRVPRVYLSGSDRME